MSGRSVSGRQTEREALIALAREEKGAEVGRVRMSRVRDASAASLVGFVVVELGSTLYADARRGYEPLSCGGFTAKSCRICASNFMHLQA